MPIMDGFTAAKKIKEFHKKDSYIFFSKSEKNERSNIYCPYIVALSASEMD